MNQFDDFLKTKAREETEDIPDCVMERIEQTLSLLPERENKTEVSEKIVLCRHGCVPKPNRKISIFPRHFRKH